MGGSRCDGLDKGDNKSAGQDDDTQPRLRDKGQVTSAEQLDGDEMAGEDKTQHKGVALLLFMGCHMSLGLSGVLQQYLEDC